MPVFARASQAEWREEVKKHFEKIKSEGTCIHRLDEELIRRRRDELRLATDPADTKYSPICEMPPCQDSLQPCLVVYSSCSLRHALDIREHYERKLERANNLYMELSAIMLQLEVREKELMK